MVKESKGSSVHIYALVDLKTGLPYAIKVHYLNSVSTVRMLGPLQYTLL